MSPFLVLNASCLIGKNTTRTFTPNIRSILRIFGVLPGLAWLAFASACGKGGADSMARDACDRQCEQQKLGTNCAEYDVTQCKQLCAFVIPALDQDCQAKAQAAFECGASQPWTCTSTIVATANNTDCQSQTQTYQDCLARQREQ